MRITPHKFKYRGKAFEGQIAMPESLEEAITLLGEEKVYNLFISGYFVSEEKRIRSKRQKKFLRLEVGRLPEHLREILTQQGYLK